MYTYTYMYMYIYIYINSVQSTWEFMTVFYAFGSFLGMTACCACTCHIARKHSENYNTNRAKKSAFQNKIFLILVALVPMNKKNFNNKELEGDINIYFIIQMSETRPCY
jgi:hypothetical protein